MTGKALTVVNMHTSPEIAADVPAVCTHFHRTLTPAKVCTYHDSGVLVVDALARQGLLCEAGYYEGQPQPMPLLARGPDAPV